MDTARPSASERRAASSTFCTLTPSANVAPCSIVFVPLRTASTIFGANAIKPLEKPVSATPGTGGAIGTSLRVQSLSGVDAVDTSPL